MKEAEDTLENTLHDGARAAESYVEYHPAAVLQPYVECYWTSTTAASAHTFSRRVLPDGCIDIIFDLSLDRLTQATVVGTMTRPLLFLASSPVHMVAVRFRPAGAVPFLRFEAEEITDSQADLAAVWPGDRLAERMGDRPGDRQEVRQLESALLARLRSASEPDHRVREAVSLLQQNGGRVEGVAAAVELSRQQLARLFRRHVGVGPKQFARVVRLRRLLSRAGEATRTDWPAAALDAGYYDQAHMITECRSLTGLTPTQLYRR